MKSQYDPKHYRNCTSCHAPLYRHTSLCDKCNQELMDFRAAFGKANFCPEEMKETIISYYAARAFQKLDLFSNLINDAPILFSYEASE